MHKYNQLLKDFPLNEILSATGLDKIQESVVLIFNHTNCKLKLSPYPIRRALPLVEAISRDFNDQLLRVLTSHRLSYQPYETFERLIGTTMGIFRTWDDCMKEFTNVAREVTRRRSEKFIPIQVQPVHAKLQERVRYLKDWRKQHEQLAVMTGPTKGLATFDKEVGGLDKEAEVKEAYKVVKSIDVLNVSVGEYPAFPFLHTRSDHESEGTEVDRSGSQLKTPLMSGFRRSKTKLYPGYETVWVQHAMRTKCSVSSRNLMHYLSGRRRVWF